MSARFSLVLLLAVADLTAAIGPNDGRPYLPIGPLKAVTGELSGEQRSQLLVSLGGAPDATKAELKRKQQEFVATLSAELQVSPVGFVWARAVCLLVGGPREQESHSLLNADCLPSLESRFRALAFLPFFRSALYNGVAVESGRRGVGTRRETRGRRGESGRFVARRPIPVPERERSFSPHIPFAQERLQAVLTDDSLTSRKEYEKIRPFVLAADAPAALRELNAAGVRLSRIGRMLPQ